MNQAIHISTSSAGSAGRWRASPGTWRRGSIGWRPRTSRPSRCASRDGALGAIVATTCAATGASPRAAGYRRAWPCPARRRAAMEWDVPGIARCAARRRRSCRLAARGRRRPDVRAPPGGPTPCGYIRQYRDFIAAVRDHRVACGHRRGRAQTRSRSSWRPTSRAATGRAVALDGGTHEGRRGQSWRSRRRSGSSDGGLRRPATAARPGSTTRSTLGPSSPRARTARPSRSSSRTSCRSTRDPGRDRRESRAHRHPARRLQLAGTHTHSGPTLREPSDVERRDRAGASRDAVDEAWRDRREATAAIGVGRVDGHRRQPAAERRPGRRSGHGRPLRR